MKFRLTRVVAPSLDVVSLADMREQLRVDAFGSPPSSPEDDYIQTLITSVVEELDAGRGWLGRALAPQTWRLNLDYFPAGDCRINLPYPPFIEVVSVTYTDTSGVTQTLTEGTDFRVISTEDGAFIVPPYNGNWPTDYREDHDSVAITYRCGYAIGSPEAANVPALVVQYIKAAVTELFDTRGVADNEMTRRGEILSRIPKTLNNLRVWNNQP